jgi:hypothetical protein
MSASCRGWLGCSFLALLSATTPERLTAQAALGVAAVVGETDSPEFKRPQGIAMSMTLYPAARFSLRGEFTIGEARERDDGALCIGPPFRPQVCYGTRTLSRTRWHEASATALVALVRTARVRLQGGVGMLVLNLDGDFIAEGGQPFEVSMGSASSTNPLFTGVLSTRPFRSRPLWMHAEYRHVHDTEFDGCVTDAFGFCGRPKRHDVRIGVSYEWAARAR